MFSVIIPLYNKAYGVKRAIESVISQNGNTPYEIIIVNDGSTDGSEKIAEKFVTDNISLFNQKNAGVSVARNVAIKKSKYDLICFLDADDWWEPDYFLTLQELVLEFPNESFFLMGFQKVTGSELKKVTLNESTRVFNNFGESFFNTKALVTPSIAVKKNVLIEAGLFPEGITVSEDLYLWSKIIKNYNVVYRSKVVSNIYYESDDSRIGRASKVPYVLDYYANNSRNISKIKGFLLYVYVAHIYQSIRTHDFNSWKMRWKVGFKIFPIFSIFTFLSIVFFVRK